MFACVGITHVNIDGLACLWFCLNSKHFEHFGSKTFIGFEKLYTYIYVCIYPLAAQS